MSYDNLPIIFAFQKLVYKTTFVLARLSKISQTSWDPFFGHMKFILWTKNGPIWGLPFSTENLWLVWMIRTFLCNDLTLMNDSPKYLGKYFNLNYVKVNWTFIPTWFIFQQQSSPCLVCIETSSFSKCFPHCNVFLLVISLTIVL